MEVHPFGATVTSWAPGGKEQLYTAPGAVPVLGRMWHGGIPVCAPWFGRGTAFNWTAPAHHGLISRVAWQLVDSELTDDGARLTLRTEGLVTRGLRGAEHFPDDLDYQLDIAADAEKLQLALTITSPTQPARVEAMFHPYLKVRGPAQLTGLGGVPFHDFSDGTVGVEEDLLPITGALDRVYPQAPPTVLHDRLGELRLDAQGANSAVVWNPGVSDTRFTRSQWRRFVCVEYGCADHGAVDLTAGGSHRLAMTLTRAPLG